MNFIGLTTTEAKQQIKRLEKGRFYQVYICIKQIKKGDTFKLNKRVHEYNENSERVYTKYENTYLIFADDEQLEKESFIIDIMKDKGIADSWSFNGYESSEKYNIYYLIVDHLQKGNKGAKLLIKSNKQKIAYKKGELSLKDRRICL